MALKKVGASPLGAHLVVKRGARCVLALHGFHVDDWFYQLTNADGQPVTGKLEVVKGRIHSITGIAACPYLEELLLAHCRVLHDFSALVVLRSLRTLEISSCKKLQQLDEIALLDRLETLVIDDVGTIESLRPLMVSRSLKWLYFRGDVSVTDGDTAVVQKLGLKDYAFQNRRHYNFTYDHLVRVP
jgi:hypothetical protein